MVSLTSPIGTRRFISPYNSVSVRHDDGDSNDVDDSGGQKMELRMIVVIGIVMLLFPPPWTTTTHNDIIVSNDNNTDTNGMLMFCSCSSPFSPSSTDPSPSPFCDAARENLQSVRLEPVDVQIYLKSSQKSIDACNDHGRLTLFSCFSQ